MSSCCERYHGSRSGKPSRDDSFGNHDAPPSRVRCFKFLVVTSNNDPSWSHSLDHIANNIASATFQVLNEGRVKTADMGGKSLMGTLSKLLIHRCSG